MLLRSLEVFKLFDDHPKCPLVNKGTREHLCKFCLLRSIVLKSKESKGRSLIQPIEFEAAFPQLDSETIIEDLESIIHQITWKLPEFIERFSLKWNCSECKLENLIIDLESKDSNEDVSILVNNFEQHTYQKHKNHDKMILKLDDECTVLMLYSEKKMRIKHSKLISFGGKKWKCRSCLTQDNSYFSTNDGFIEGSNTNEFMDLNGELSDVQFAIYELSSKESVSNHEDLVYRGMSDNLLIRKCVPKREDRHKSNEDRHKSSKDRHKSNKDRHIASEKRRKDRHIASEKRRDDRHIASEKRREDRHLSNEKRKKDRHQSNYHWNNTLADLQTDTGMDCPCSCCLELRSRKSCSTTSTLPPDQISKYVVDNQFTRANDGKLYVCATCKISLKVGKEPVRSQKELLGYLDFPKSFKNSLHKVCMPIQISNQETLITLNKLEDFILKLAIPFIRIGHLPPGNYFRVKGSLIMISSDLQSSMNRILPVSQNLIPVSFKRKLEYSGYFMEEYIDKHKVLAYFQWLKKYNHLFEDYNLDEALIEEFQNQALSAIKEDNSMEIEDEENSDIDTVFAHSTVIIDKYREDMSSNTASTKLARMVIQLEDKLCYEESEFLVKDPEDELYEEDIIDDPD